MPEAARCAARLRALWPALWAALLLVVSMSALPQPAVREQGSPDAGCRFASVPGDVDGRWKPRAREEAWALALHARYVARAALGGARLVFLGDSITQGWRVAPQVWQEHYAAQGALDFGISGDTVQQLAWRIEQGTLDGLAPKVLVLLIGTNNLPVREPRQLAQAIGSLTGLMRCAAPGAKVLLLGILPRAAPGNSPDADARMGDNVRAVNAALARLGDGRRLVFLDMGARFAGADGTLRKDITPDGLHLNAAGYLLWAQSMQPTLDAMLRD
jgi:lysophospholipase L1-like esterase